MIFTQVSRTEADKVFVVGKNVSGTALSSHVPVELDIVSVTDGHAFTACKSSTGHLPALFLGITDRACADSEDGVLVQVYGFRQSAYISQASAAIPPGVGLRPSLGKFISGGSAAIYVTLMESTSAKSAGTVDVFNVFIRAM